MSEQEKAWEAGAVFEFGVDETELGFRLTLNGRIAGVYLYPDANGFRARINDDYPAVIAPDRVDSHRIEHDDGHNVAIYVSPERFEQFCQDAQVVYDLYCDNDVCFRCIPDLWFSDLALVQFVRGDLQPHPAMRHWFQRGVQDSWSGAWIGPKLTR